MLKASRFLFITTILLGYLFLSIFSLFHVAHMSEMGMPMKHCPYMIGEKSLCQMSISDHLMIWQQQFSSAVFPSLIVLLFIATIISAFLWYFSPPTPFLLYKKRQQKNISPPLYQQLFSQGILNPKPY